CFFFSSRRRHTRCYRDWSSDVCSSDLFLLRVELQMQIAAIDLESLRACSTDRGRPQIGYVASAPERHGAAVAIDRRDVDVTKIRSEERRVGKEGRDGWSGKRDHGKRVD